MKAIVVRQPWATLIALGVKTIETRPAPPNGPMRPDGVRGLPGLAVERGERIAIVAGAKPADYRDSAWLAVEERLGSGVSMATRHWGYMGADPLPLGAVVCTVTVDDAAPIIDLLTGEPDELCGISPAIYVAPGSLTVSHHFEVPAIWIEMPHQLPLGDFTPGRWGWMLSDPQPCDPIPCKGRQGVFELPADVAEQVTR